MTEAMFSAFMYWWGVGFAFGILIHVSGFAIGGGLQWLKELH